MAEPRYPNIQTGIGTGRAQVFGANDNSAAFQQIGAALGANTKGAKLKRRQKATEEKLKFLDDLDYGGLTPAQLRFQRQYEEEIRDNATSPEFWQQENAAQILEDKIRDLAILNQENKNAADMGKLVQENTKGKDKQLFNNYDDYKQYYSPEFDIPDAIAKTPAEKARVYNETFVGTTNSVTQEFDYEPMEDFDFSNGIKTDEVTVERDGKSIGTTRRTFTESKRKELEEDAVAKLISGMKQERQGDGFSAPKDVSFYKDITEYVDNNPKYKSRFNAADEQGRLEILKQASKEFVIKEGESTLNQGFEQSPVKDSGDGDKYDPQNYEAVTEKLNIQGSYDEEKYTLGNLERQTFRVPDVKVTYSDNGQTYEGEIQKITYDDNGKRIAIVRQKGGADEAGRATMVETIVSYDKVEDELSKKDRDLHKTLFNEIESKGEGSSLMGLGRERANILSKAADGSADRLFNDNESAREVAEVAFGDDAEFVSDPSNRDDISFSFNLGSDTLSSESVSFDLGNSGDRKDFERMTSGYAILQEIAGVQNTSVQEILRNVNESGGSVKDYLLRVAKENLD